MCVQHYMFRLNCNSY